MEVQKWGNNILNKNNLENYGPSYHRELPKTHLRINLLENM
jgi:hypothetical protein